MSSSSSLLFVKVKSLNALLGYLKDFLRLKHVPTTSLTGKRADLEAVFASHVFVNGPSLPLNPLANDPPSLQSPDVNAGSDGDGDKDDDAYLPDEGDRIEMGCSPWLTTAEELAKPWSEFVFIRRELEENQDGDMEWCCFLQPMIGKETTGDPEMECFLTDLNWAYLYPCEACECQTQEKILQNLWYPPAIEKRPRACALSPRGPIIRPPRFVVTSQLLVPKPLPQSPIPKPLHASCLSINPFSNFFQMRSGGFFTYFNYMYRRPSRPLEFFVCPLLRSMCLGG